MKDRLYKIMYDLEDIIEQIEDCKNVLNMTYITGNPELIKSVLNIQKRLIEAIETDSRNLHNEIDKKILDLVHNKI